MTHAFKNGASTPDAAGIVVLAYGPQPMRFLTDASKLCGAGAVLDTNVARMAGADFACGSPAALKALQERLTPGALATAARACSGQALSPEAIQWLALGDRGTSSNTIFSVITGQPCEEDGHGYPHDPADLIRCHRLLEQCPEIARVFHAPDSPMLTISPEWAALVPAWNELCQLLDEECPGWRAGSTGSARKTYLRMKELIAGAKAGKHQEADCS